MPKLSHEDLLALQARKRFYKQWGEISYQFEVCKLSHVEPKALTPQMLKAIMHGYNCMLHPMDVSVHIDRMFEVAAATPDRRASEIYPAPDFNRGNTRGY